MKKIKELFQLKGRMRRRDFLLYQLLLFVLGFINFGLAFSEASFLYFFLFFQIGFMLAEAYISVKRLHDCNFSGLFSLTFLLSLIGSSFILLNIFIILILSIYPGTSGENEYGNDPREQNIIT